MKHCVYVDLTGCTRPIDVIQHVEAALCQAGLPGLADWYREQMRDVHPHTPEAAAMRAPDCVVYRKEEALPN